MTDNLDSILEKNLPDEELNVSENDTEVKDVQPNTEENEDVIEKEDNIQKTIEPVEGQEVKIDGQEDPEPIIKRPSGWKQDYDQAWASLSPDLKKYIYDREHSADVLSSTNGVLKKQIDSFNEAIKPVASYLDNKAQSNNMSRDEYIAGLVDAEMALESNPDRAIMQIMEIYRPQDPLGLVNNLMKANGITTEHLTNTNPYQSQLMSLLQQEREEKFKLQQQMSENEYQKNMSEQNSIIQAYDNFKINHPEYNEEQKDMFIKYMELAEMQNQNLNDVEIMEKAYELMTGIPSQQAISNPLKETMIENVDPVEEFKKQQAEKVKKAKEASASISSQPPSDPVVSKRSYSTAKEEKNSIDMILAKNGA